MSQLLLEQLQVAMENKEQTLVIPSKVKIHQKLTSSIQQTSLSVSESCCAPSESVSGVSVSSTVGTEGCLLACTQRRALQY